MGMYLTLFSGMGFPGSSVVNNLPAMHQTQVWSLGREDPLEKEMATHFSILSWEIPWTKEPGGLQSMSQRVGHDWGTEHALTRGDYKQISLLSIYHCFLTLHWESLLLVPKVDLLIALPLRWLSSHLTEHSWSVLSEILKCGYGITDFFV